MNSRGVVEVIAKEVDDERRRKQQQKITQQQQNRLCGRPARSTARSIRNSVDRRGRPARTTCTWKELGRPPGRPTESTQLSVGHPVDLPVHRRKGRSTARSTDKRVRAASADSKICLYLRVGCFLGFVSYRRSLRRNCWSSLTFKEAVSNCNLLLKQLNLSLIAPRT